MGKVLCWDRWKNIISGKIDSSIFRMELVLVFKGILHLPTVAEDELDVGKQAAAAPAPAATPEAAMTSAESLCDFVTIGKE